MGGIGAGNRNCANRIRAVLDISRLGVEDSGLYRDRPRLLSRNPAAMRADYVDTTDKAMRGEPEALRADQLADLIDGKQRAARARVDSFKDTTLAGIEALSTASRNPTSGYRRRRNSRRSRDGLQAAASRFGLPALGAGH
jgi:hypothetical protein